MLEQFIDKKKIRKKIDLYFKAQSTINHWMGLEKSKDLGFFIPYSFKEQLHVPNEFDQIPWVAEQLKNKEQVFLHEIKKLEAYAEEFSVFQKADPENANRPRFDQGWFPGMDAAMAYSMVRTQKPKRIIEVGSGHSTRFLHQAIVDEEIECHLHSIDPAPRKDIDLVCDEITRETVTNVSAEFFDQLQAGDILFIDCSHIAMPGSDVDFLFTQVLPRLQKGVLVHVHDIFIPFGYPESWKWRGYNEQMLLLAILAVPNAYEILWPSYYMRRNFSEEIEKSPVTLFKGAMETSFWLRKSSNPA